jgi:hypothetical protein
MTTIVGLNSLRYSSIKAAQDGQPLTSAWSGEILVATAWFLLYLAIVGLTISSESLSSAIEIVARY